MEESGCSSIRPVSDMHTGLNLSISKAKVLCINAKPEAPMTVYGDPLDSLVKKTSLQVLGRKGTGNICNTPVHLKVRAILSENKCPTP